MHRTHLTLLLVIAAPLLSAQIPSKDISGTWVGKRTSPMGEMEFVYELKLAGGKITGAQRMPFGDSPVVDGRFISANEFELVVETGADQRATIKGKVTGDALEITPAMPARGPGGPGGGPGGPGGGPGGNAPRPGGPGGPGFGGPGGPPGGPGAGMRAMNNQPLTFRQGVPTPSYRAPSVDYAKLPKLALPAVRDIPYNGLAKTPPMGWNSWNKFRTKIDDKTVREIADVLVASGMRDAGYTYINIDDGWQAKTRDDKGVLQPNPGFPDMKALSRYIHSKGLKLGIYSSPGPTTCGGFQGSYGHEELDAKTWAEWGIDYLKYDWCSASRVWKDEDMRAVYQRMADALRATRRPIVYSLCQYGRQNVHEWGPKVGGNLWRTTFDIRDQWQSMAQIGFAQTDLAQWARPGAWLDPDMLEIGNGGMTATEYRTHMSLWAMIAAPLIAGNDLRAMDTGTKEILMNRDVIAVNQDPLGKAGARVWQNGETEAWVRPLDKGGYAVALFNRGGAEATIAVPWDALKINGIKKVRDLWEHKDNAPGPAGLSAAVPSHGVAMYRLSR